MVFIALQIKEVSDAIYLGSNVVGTEARPLVVESRTVVKGTVEVDPRTTIPVTLEQPIQVENKGVSPLDVRLNR